MTRIPRAIAPLVTTITSAPSRCRAASWSQTPASTSVRGLPSLSATTLDPSLMTTRLIGVTQRRRSARASGSRSSSSEGLVRIQLEGHARDLDLVPRLKALGLERAEARRSCAACPRGRPSRPRSRCRSAGAAARFPGLGPRTHSSPSRSTLKPLAAAGRNTMCSASCGSLRSVRARLAGRHRSGSLLGASATVRMQQLPELADARRRSRSRWRARGPPGRVGAATPRPPPAPARGSADRSSTARARAAAAPGARRAPRARARSSRSCSTASASLAHRQRQGRRRARAPAGACARRAPGSRGRDPAPSLAPSIRPGMSATTS